jgi:hypothetical protein
MTTLLQDILASLQSIERSLKQREEAVSLRTVPEANAKSEIGGTRAGKVSCFGLCTKERLRSCSRIFSANDARSVILREISIRMQR